MTSEASIAVVGVGAIGGSVAAAIGDVGHRVQLCVRTSFDELQRELNGETTVYEHSSVADQNTSAPVDWLLLATKAHQTASAKIWFDRLVGSKTRVAILQNGVEHTERLDGLVDPSATLLPCVVRLPATAIGPGNIVQDRNGKLVVPTGPVGDEFQNLFTGQDAIRVETTDDFISVAWDKLVRNAATGICALTRTSMGVMAEPAARELALGLIREIVAVGEAEGAVFSPELEQKFFASYEGNETWTSIAKDARDGKPTEWDARNAVIGRIGRKHGIATPINDAITTLLKLADA